MLLLYDVRGSRPIARRSTGALDQSQALMAAATTLPPAQHGDGLSQGRPTFVRAVTLVGAVAIVVGNMVGTSMYTLPASPAHVVGPLGILPWLLTALGDFGVAFVYANLGARYPRTGGPYGFAREAFGDFGGVLSVWLYWISALIGNAGIVTGVIAYAEGFLPVLSADHVLRFVVA